MPSFATNLQPGDIIYGLSKAREPYIASLPPLMAEACRDAGNRLYADEFNNRTFLSLADSPKKKLVKNPFNSIDLERNVKAHFPKGLFSGKGTWMGPTGEQILTKTQRKALKAFYDKLSASKYAPDATAKAYDAGDLAEKRDMLPMILIRRACKFGLEYAIMKRQVTVHFVLDYFDHQKKKLRPMDQQGVVDKSIWGSDLSPPITTSELRCCYRNKDIWMPTGRLKFYSKLFEVPAPWVADPGLWQEYADHREQKANIPEPAL
jgi:hypothetical protein